MYIAEKNFKPRLTKPEAGNPYYNRKPKGYSGCILGNPLDKGCDILANCEGYATARFNEETQEGKELFFGKMNACTMYSYAQKYGMEVGIIPKVGALACWSGGSSKLGHAVICEKVYADDDFLSSESGYKSYIYKNQRRKKGDGNWGMGNNYKFLGFVYNPHIIKLAEPVERNMEVNQLQVIKNKLRIRVKPSLKADILDFAELGYYNDLETVEADGYTWHKIADNNWLADVDDYVELLPKIDFEMGDIVTLQKPIIYYQVINIVGNTATIIPVTGVDNLIKEDK